MDDRTRCRMCGATEPKRDPFTNAPRNWEVAAPTDAFEGETLLDYTEVWCSQECRDNDPSYRPFADGADMAHSYQRYAEATGGDLIGALARSRGVSRDKAESLFSEGCEKALRKLRKTGRQ